MADAGLDAHDFSAFSSIDGSTEFPARELTFMTLSSDAALSFASICRRLVAGLLPEKTLLP